MLSKNHKNEGAITRVWAAQPRVKKKNILNNFSIDFNLLYRVVQQESLIFWGTVVPVIVSEKVHMHMCVIPNGYRDGAI